jgi:hypothetical protein
MKVRVTFKTPDAVDRALEDAAPDGYCDPSVAETPEVEGMAAAKELIGKFVKWGELVTIEFDTAAGTATVVPVR